MPIGVYKRTKKHKQKISKSLKGKKKSLKSVRKAVETKRRKGIFSSIAKKIWDTRRKNGTDSNKHKENCQCKMCNGEQAKKAWKTRRKNKNDIPWSKNLTKETDERIRRWAKKTSKSLKKYFSIQENKEKFLESQSKLWYKKQTSNSCKLFLNKIEKIYKVKIKREFRIKNKFYDGKYKNILFEIDGNFWHSSKKSLKNDILKEQIATKNNYTLYRFEVNSEHEINDKIKKYENLLNKIFKKQ